MEQNELNKNNDSISNAKDLLNVSLIFARALSLIFKDGQGIVVDIIGDIDLGEETKKVIVYNKDGQIHIYKADDEIPEGTAVELNDGEEVKEN